MVLPISEEFAAFYRGHVLFLGALRRNFQNPLKLHLVHVRSVGLAHSRPWDQRARSPDRHALPERVILRGPDTHGDQLGVVSQPTA